MHLFLGGGEAKQQQQKSILPKTANSVTKQNPSDARVQRASFGLVNSLICYNTSRISSFLSYLPLLFSSSPSSSSSSFLVKPRFSVEIYSLHLGANLDLPLLVSGNSLYSRWFIRNYLFFLRHALSYKISPFPETTQVQLVQRMIISYKIIRKTFIVISDRKNGHYYGPGQIQPWFLFYFVFLFLFFSMC